MGHSKRERTSNKVFYANPPSRGVDCGSTGDVYRTKRMADLIKELEENGECAVFGGPWFESLEKK